MYNLNNLIHKNIDNNIQYLNKLNLMHTERDADKISDRRFRIISDIGSEM